MTAALDRAAATSVLERVGGLDTMLTTEVEDGTDLSGGQWQRFSTVSAADRVVVLHEGKVAEVGTHAELMAANGRYAELYELQAKGYR